MKFRKEEPTVSIKMGKDEQFIQVSAIKVPPTVSFYEMDEDILVDSKSQEDKSTKLKARKMSTPCAVRYDVECFVRDRSVDSDSGVSSMESVLDSLTKLAKSISPKQAATKGQITETLEDDNKGKRRERYERQVNYFAPSNLFNRNFNLFRPEDEQKKALKARIEAKVLRSVKHAVQGRHCLIVESVCKLETNLSVAQRKLSAFNPRKAAVEEEIVLHESVQILRRSKPSICQAKPSVQRLQDLSTGWYCYQVTVRNNAAWEKVKPSSDGMKKKVELFAPKAKNTAQRATEVVEEESLKPIVEIVIVYLMPEEKQIEEEVTACLDTEVNTSLMLSLLH